MSETHEPPRRRLPVRFSVGTLLLVVTLVAVFFAGRASLQRTTPVTGAWTFQVHPESKSYSLQLNSLGDGLYEVTGNPNLVMVGVYRWEDGKLVMEKPRDKRYDVLVWRWVNNGMVLIDEPPDHPSGGSYLGARMWPKK